MEQGLLYGTYAAAGGIALAVYCALPKERQASRTALAVILSALALGGLVLLLGRLLGQSAGEVLFLCFERVGGRGGDPCGDACPAGVFGAVLRGCRTEHGGVDRDGGGRSFWRRRWSLSMPGRSW